MKKLFFATLLITARLLQAENQSLEEINESLRENARSLCAALAECHKQCAFLKAQETDNEYVKNFMNGALRTCEEMCGFKARIFTMQLHEEIAEIVIDRVNKGNNN